MKANGNGKLGACVTAGLLLCFTGAARAKSYGNGQGGQSGQSQPAPQPTDKDKNKPPATEALTLDTPVPVNAEEEAAFKIFQDTSLSDAPKKIQLGEAFSAKYPESRYRPIIYSTLVSEYLTTGDLDKMQAIGEKEIALKPDDAQTLAILGQTLSRLAARTQDPTQRAAMVGKSEKYSKQAIETLPTLPKPPNLSDEAFATAKNVVAATAHSGLGLAYLMQNKSSDAASELDQAVKVDPTPDPVNYYLLGMANEKASHFDEAIAAFNKCAAGPGSMQASCKNGAEEAKKLSQAQLSAPK
jgi:tetratricopeptide (TPR) repeat protein